MPNEVVIEGQFPTSGGALFSARLEQLTQQLPGWRVPLPEYQRRTVTNPFTGELIPDVLTRDPGPRTQPGIPERLVFPCVRLPAREDWEENYLALDLALSAVPPLSASDWEDGWFELMLERGLLEEALFGGLDEVGETWQLHEVPPRLVERLLELQPVDLRAMADAWLARCNTPADAPEQYLAQFCELARQAQRTNARMFSWNVHPCHREKSD